MTTQQNGLLDRIRQRLYWDKRVSMVDVKVACGPNEGGMIATGEVDSYFKKQAALELIRNTEGVHTVEDLISVQLGMHRSDETLRAIIEAELEEVVLQKGEAVHVMVFGGVVELTGTVYRKRTKALASGFCWELSGVRDCLNHIVLSDMPPPAADLQLWRLTHFEVPKPLTAPTEHGFRWYLDQASNLEA